MEGTSGLPASTIGERLVDGKTLNVVRVTLENGDPIDCYIDPATGAYVQAVIDPDGAYETTIHIRSYATPLPGKKLIGSYTLDDDKSVISYDTFEPNVPISTGELHPPQPTASWTFESLAPVPITLTRKRILVSATVNGVRGRFILDTGADAIYPRQPFCRPREDRGVEGERRSQIAFRYCAGWRAKRRHDLVWRRYAP